MLHEIYDGLNISENDVILCCDPSHSTLYRTFLHKILSFRKIKDKELQIQKIVDSTLSHWEADSKDKPINLARETKKFTSSIIAKVFLGYEGSIDDLSKAIDIFFDYMGMLLGKKCDF